MATRTKKEPRTSTRAPKKKGGRSSAATHEPAVAPVRIAVTTPLRVDLLPESVTTARKQAALRELLLLGLVGLVAIVAAASFAVNLFAGQAEGRLAAEQARTLDIASQTAEYSDVVLAQQQLSDYDAASLAALYDEVDWSKVTSSFHDALPSGASVLSLSISVTGADGTISPITDALSAPGVVQLKFTTTDTAFVPAAQLLERFSGITGYIDGVIESITSGEDGYVYTGSLSLGIEVVGNTARAAALDADQAADMRTALEQAVEQQGSIQTPEASPSTDATTGDGTDTTDTTGTGTETGGN